MAKQIAQAETDYYKADSDTDSLEAIFKSKSEKPVSGRKWKQSEMMEEVETRDDKTSKPVLRSHLENVTLNTLIRDLLDLTADQWLALITKDNFE